MSDHTRLSVNVNDEAAAALRKRAAEGTSVTESMRRAIAMLDYFYEQAELGNEIRIVRRWSWRRPLRISVASRTYTLVLHEGP